MAVCNAAAGATSFAAHRIFCVVEVCSSWISFLEVGDIVMVSATCKLANRLCSANNKSIWIPLVARLMFDIVGPKQLLGRPTETLEALDAAMEYFTGRNDSSSSLMVQTLRTDERYAHPSSSTLRHLFVDSDVLATTFLSILHRVVSQCAQQAMSRGALQSWPKILAQKLSLCGFETFSYQVRIIRLVATALTTSSPTNSAAPSGTAPSAVTRQMFRVIERLLLVLTHYQSMRSTEVGDHEGVQEIVAAIGNSMEEAIEYLKPIFKHASKHSMHARPLSRMILEIKRQCVSVSNSVAAASQLAEMNDHPDGQDKYDSLWAVYRAAAVEQQSTSRPAHFVMPTCDSERVVQSSPFSHQVMSSVLMIPLKDGKYSSCLSEAQMLRLRSIRLVRVADIVDYFFRMPKSEQEHFRSNVLSLYRLTAASMEGSDEVPTE
jgi:hypothetical protein